MEMNIQPLSDPEEIRAAAAANTSNTLPPEKVTAQPEYIPNTSANTGVSPENHAANIAIASDKLQTYKPKKLHGLYVILVWMIIEVLISLWVTKFKSTVILGVAAVQVILVVALLARINVARIILLIFSWLGIALGLVGLRFATPSGFLSLATNAYIVWYLSRKDVRSQF